MFYPHDVDEPVDNGYRVWLGGDMKPRSFPLVLVLVALGLVAGCSATDSGSAEPVAVAAAGEKVDVVDFEGIGDIDFGATKADLARRGLLITPAEACGPRLAGLGEVSPVFAGERLALLWVNPPLTTPEGVGVGSSLGAARAAYPQATALTAPAGSYGYDGLMVTRGDRAYLFLHDGQTVKKSVAGYAEQVRLLFDEGFGTC
jgi:hypothetical protein